MLKLIPVQSSNIKAIGYSPETREMRVQFNSGAIYTHADVPVRKHAEFIAAKSKGGHYNDNFRGKHAVKKLESQ
jgi:hypothetical protein